jgi:hypothetical protein
MKHIFSRNLFLFIGILAVNSLICFIEWDIITVNTRSVFMPSACFLQVSWFLRQTKEIFTLCYSVTQFLDWMVQISCCRSLLIYHTCFMVFMRWHQRSTFRNWGNDIMNMLCLTCFLTIHFRGLLFGLSEEQSKGAITTACRFLLIKAGEYI